MELKQVKVNGIIAGTDLNGKTAEAAILEVAVANQISSFDVLVDGEEVSPQEAKEIGSDWSSIELRTVEKPA